MYFSQKVIGTSLSVHCTLFLESLVELIYPNQDITQQLFPI